MTDRIPLDEAVKPEQEITPEEPRETEGVGGGRLSEMRDMHDLAIMLGFPGADFDGLGTKASAIYDWAMSYTEGNKPLYAIKMAINTIGVRDTGKDLLNRLHQWCILDNSVQKLQERKRLIHDRS